MHHRTQFYWDFLLDGWIEPPFPVRAQYAGEASWIIHDQMLYFSHQAFVCFVFSGIISFNRNWSFRANKENSPFPWRPHRTLFLVFRMTITASTSPALGITKSLCFHNIWDAPPPPCFNARSCRLTSFALSLKHSSGFTVTSPTLSDEHAGF